MAQKPKQEDWLLVLSGGDPAVSGSRSPTPENSAGKVSRASGDPVSGGPRGAQSDVEDAVSPTVPIAGWVLARFIELNLPGPVRDYMRAPLICASWPGSS